MVAASLLNDCEAVDSGEDAMSRLSEQMDQDMLVRGFSVRTRDSYLRAVRGLSKYYQRSPDQISEAQVQRYLAYLIGERKLAWSSCNIAVSGLRFFYRHTLGRDETHFEIPRARQRQRIPEIPSAAAIAQVLEQTCHVRDRAMIMLAFGAGLRVSEIARLKVADIDSGQMCIRVHGGKGDKDRLTLLPERLLRALRRYWSAYHPHRWLFEGRDRNRPISVSVVQKSWKRAQRRAGVSKPCGMHCLRHAFATAMLENGVDLATLQRLLGHGNIGTTQRYLHVSAERMIQTVSPLDRLTELKEPEH